MKTPCRLLHAGLAALLLLCTAPAFAQAGQGSTTSTSSSATTSTTSTTDSTAGGGASPQCLECGPGGINLPPTVSVTSPTAGQAFITGQGVTLTASASDSDGAVSSVTFLVDGVSVGIVTSEPYTQTWVATAGSHTVRAKATDDGGKSITSSPVTITVAGPANPPGTPTPLPPVAGATSRLEVITYHNDLTHWVLGQTASVTCVASVPANARCDGDDVVAQTTYDANTALPTARYANGKLQQTLTYNADGTLASLVDGRGNATTFASWKRGIPQAIAYADGKTQSATVNDSGWITAVTDESGSKTCYGFDAMGRITSITPPSEAAPGTCATTTWTATTQSFVPVSTAEYGLSAGHWRQTVSTGNAVKITYVDALWRPVLVRAYDAGNLATTERFTRTVYDAGGRVGFASYPSNTSTPTTGVWTDYDALGRVTSVAQDSELGLLVTTSEYLTGFQTRITTPRGYQTVSSYLTYDQPSTDMPVAVSAPEGQLTTISRDPDGKPTALTRGGSGSTVTRYYGYNAQQELCRSEEPETGTTLYGYDAAGNLSWSAAGLPAGTPCSDGLDGAIVARRVSRTYDPRNRLATLAFPDGNGNQSWTYTADGLPATVTTANGGNPVTNTWTYNRRRLPTAESVTPDPSKTFTIAYGYNALGQVTSETVGDGVSLTYTVNALGQVTQVKTGTTTLASNASYYPNGALAQFTYGNGIVHTMTQNARQLPSHSVDGTVLDLATVFDENGNVAAITDNTASGRQTRSMTYDGLDRLTSTTSPMFGTASYAYDPQDNLTRVQVTGGSQARDHYYCYTASNQLAFVRSGPACTGTASPAVIALAYDVQGNLSNKNGASYAFDFGNRLRTTAGQNYRYDAQGRRVRQDVAGSQLQYSQYAADGRLLWQRDETTNQRIANAYLAGSLLAEISRPLTGNTTTIRYLHTDALGSPIAKTSASGAIIETSEYEPYGRLLNRANDNRAGYTGHVMDAASGLTYMQARYYDPSIGAFLSVDPVTAYSNPVGAFNRYRYADGNPYRFTDPDGRQTAGTDYLEDLSRRQEMYDEWREARRQEMNNKSDRLGGGANSSNTLTYRSQASTSQLLRTWSLRRASRLGGWVIQYVQIDVITTNAAGKIVTSHHEYWEGWPVDPGKRGATPSADRFMASVPSGFLSGTAIWTGHAAFFEGMDKPANFTRGGAPEAGMLQSSSMDPGLDWSRGTAPVITTWVYSWP